MQTFFCFGIGRFPLVQKTKNGKWNVLILIWITICKGVTNFTSPSHILNIQGKWFCNCSGQLLAKMDAKDCLNKDNQRSCLICDKTYKFESKLKEHIQRAHGQLKQNSCSKCSKAFKLKSNLQEHIQLVHEKLRPFSCDVCGKTFQRSQSQQIHMRTHTGEKLYICFKCSKYNLCHMDVCVLGLHPNVMRRQVPWKCKEMYHYWKIANRSKV